MTSPNRPVASLLALLTGFFVLERAALATPAKITGTAHAYLRSGPGIDSPPIATLDEGDRVETLETSGVWTKVQTPGGRTGYVYHTYVVIGDAEPAPPVEPGLSSPEPPPAAPSPPDTAEVSAELAELRAQIADLKDKVSERVDQGAAQAAPGSLAPVATAAPGVVSSTSSDPAPPPSVGSLAVGLVAFILGCFTGAALTRRRGRTQRSRLRF